MSAPTNADLAHRRACWAALWRILLQPRAVAPTQPQGGRDDR